MAGTNYHFHSEFMGKIWKQRDQLCNISFSEMAKLLNGSLAEEDVALPKHWQSRMFPGNAPRVGFAAETVARALKLSKQVRFPKTGEPGMDFSESGFWVESKGTRTGFHADEKIQLVVPCHGRKLWHFLPSEVEYIHDLPGVGDAQVFPDFAQLMKYAWHLSGSLDLCKDGQPWAASQELPKVQRCTLRPGDVLYLPHAFGHDVEALDSSFHITLRLQHELPAEVKEASVALQTWAQKNGPGLSEDDED